MSGIPHIFRRIVSTARNGDKRGRVFRSALAVAFFIASAGQTLSAQAAAPGGPAQGLVTTIYLDIRVPPAPICAGKSYTVSVITIADKDFVVGTKAKHQSAEPTGGVAVTPKSSDPGVATLSPDTAVVSGFDLDLEPGEAAFTLDAKKAGVTVLTFSTKFQRKAGSDSKAITVVNCEYKVNMLYHLDYQGVIIGDATMSSTISGDGGQLAGSGIMDLHTIVNGGDCDVTVTDFEGPTNITGQVSSDGEQLQLGFTYGSAPTTISATCPGASGSATENPDPTPYLVASADFPASGGTRTFGVANGATLTITAEPVEEGSG